MGHEQNAICLSTNPIMDICLACVHLKAIGKSIAVFAHRNDNVTQELLNLGLTGPAAATNLTK